MGTFLVILICFGLLYLWAHHHALERTAKTKERQAGCPHPPESQQTLRVNNVMTMNPVLVHAKLPGRRWLVKQCRACGKQTMMYRPNLQPWDDFVSEYNQETLDREYQYKARESEHKAAVAAAERIRVQKREKEIEKHGRAS